MIESRLGEEKSRLGDGWTLLVKRLGDAGLKFLGSEEGGFFTALGKIGVGKLLRDASCSLKL